MRVLVVGLSVVCLVCAIDYGPTYGKDYAGMDYNVTHWSSPQSNSPDNWKASAVECEQYCLNDPNCCVWTYVTPIGNAAGERCCLKNGIPKEIAASTHWTGAAPRAVNCSSGPPYPGPPYNAPTIHHSPTCLHVGGWHDIAGALTFKGTHHVFQGCPASGGWSHAASTDLVHWQDRGIHVIALNETWGDSSPCSGFVTVDDDGVPCAGFRQCSSDHGIVKAWDVPLELRCAKNDALTEWGDPEYIFDVFFNRPLPYDPVRPWIDHDKYWYATISTDGCNASSVPCAAGGAEWMWRSPKLHGPGANWTKLPVPMIVSNVTVLPDAFLDREMVTAGYFGNVPGDPRGGASRVFTNNVGGEGCCSGTPQYVVGLQANGSPLKVDYSDPNAIGMLDWGAFTNTGAGTKKGVDALSGTASRGFSMARTLGGDANHVIGGGRRVLVGWIGETPASQSLSRDLSFSPQGELLQQFVPELQTLRQGEVDHGMQVEVLATMTPGSDPTVPVGVSVLYDDDLRQGVDVFVNGTAELVCVVDRCGPLLGGLPVTAHIYVDHSILEVIFNNRTAITRLQTPSSATADGIQTFAGVDGTVTAKAWGLASI